MKNLFKFSLLLLFSASWAQTNIQGTIYNDANKNGKKDRNETGIPKVSVTNGTDVVQTNQNGTYTLPATDDMIVSVIKPAGYVFPLNDENLSQFYYIHKPLGSPQTKYPGVNPTGKLPKTIDFGLYPTTEKDNFSILVFGDPQPYNQTEVDYFANGVVQEIANNKQVLFGMSLGDLVGNDLSLFKPYKEAIKKANIPWVNVIGNHDLNFDVTEDRLSDESYEANFGPANYAFNYGKVHFIVLDDILYPDPRAEEKYWGGFREDQLAFVANDLKFVPKDHLIVLAFHIPLKESEAKDLFKDSDREKLFELLKDYPHTLSLSAHTHLQRQDFFGKESGWLQDRKHHEYNAGTTSGDWYSGLLDNKGIPYSTMRDGTPKGYAFIDFNNNNYKIRYKVAGQTDTYQMQIFAPKVLAKTKNTPTLVYANFFMGSNNDKVFYRIDDGKWNPMEYSEEADPSYQATILNRDLSETLLPGKRGSNPSNCTHLWKGKMLSNLAVGTHTIEVKAQDMYGKEYLATTTYRIEKQTKE